MKKELIAGAILILILAASIFNIWFITDRTDRLSAQIAQARDIAAEGETDKAAQVFRQSMEDWQKLDSYVHIMLRHEEIDPINDEYYIILEELENGEASRSSFENLLGNLENLAKMESLSLSSIF